MVAAMSESVPYRPASDSKRQCKILLPKGGQQFGSCPTRRIRSLATQLRLVLLVGFASRHLEEAVNHWFSSERFLFRNILRSGKHLEQWC